MTRKAEDREMGFDLRRTTVCRRAMLLASVGAIAATGLVIASPELAGAVGTESFVLDSSESLAAGELTGTAVHSDGRVTIGANLERVAMPDDVALIYSVARGAGGTAYLGTGPNGRIYRLSGTNVELFAETGQMAVTSLATDGAGNVYAGTIPEGRIYKIGANGQPQELARPDQVEHVWALAWDGGRNRLIAGTGPEGRLYAIDAQGAAQILWDSTASHVMSVTLGADGAVYAGTSDDAVVARVTAAGQTSIVFDFPGNEITALDFSDGVLAVGANEFADPPAIGEAHSKVRGATAGRAPRPRPGKGRIYRIGRDGRTERVFAQEEGHITSVDILPDGTIYGGTGHEGRVIRVNADRSYATWADVEERQVLGVSIEGDAPILTTGDGAAVYRVATGRPQGAIWESKVLDGRFPARWGQLSWRGEGQLVFQTRSGNTEHADDTWSQWSADLTAAGPVRSPQARYLQIRARFDRDPDAVIQSVNVFFLPQNQRAAVTEVRVDGPNKAATDRLRAERRDTIPEPSSIYKLAWVVDNADGDRLRYRLHFRQDNQTVWREILREGEILTATEYDWQTAALPDGHYVVRVEASDELTNPGTLTLRDTRESELLRIDNHAPVLDALRFAGGRLQGRAVDGLGPVAALDYAIDGGDWLPTFPDDDLFDTATESFVIDLSALPAGTHVVAVRATDASGNVASQETQIRSGN